jgi:hypothetical protein
MYCDILGLITCAVGNLIDPIGLAEQLSWTFADGSKADLAQVRADWHLLKNGAAHYSKLHWKFALAATKVRLTDEAIDNLVASKRAEFEMFLKSHYFKDWDSFPADAQLGIMSMAWACGPGFPLKFGNFRKAALAQDWEACVATCKIRETGNPGVVPRNKLNRFCFHNAALVKAGELDPTRLYWPEVASQPTVGNNPERDAAEAARATSQEALDHFVRIERERFLDEGPSAARDLRDWEEPHSDTEPAPPPDGVG